MSYEELLAWCIGNNLKLIVEYGSYTLIKVYDHDGDIICQTKGIEDPLLYKEAKRYIIEQLNPKTNA